MQGGSAFGSSVATAGDVNGDGFPDTILGGPSGTVGGAFVHYGNGGDGLNRIPRQARADGTAPIALLGKSDSETSIRLRERGLTPAGRGEIRLQYEIKPFGTPFSGMGLGTTTAQDTGTPGATGSAVSFDEAVTGLSEGTFYRWRSRIASSDPFFPRSPWMSLAGNNVTETKLRTAGCVDRDGDGYGELSDPSCPSLVLDCDDQSASAWGTPGETLNLRFTSSTNLVWDPPADPGAPASDRPTTRSDRGRPAISCPPAAPRIRRRSEHDGHRRHPTVRRSGVLLPDPRAECVPPRSRNPRHEQLRGAACRGRLPLSARERARVRLGAENDRLRREVAALAARSRPSSSRRPADTSRAACVSRHVCSRPRSV